MSEENQGIEHLLAADEPLEPEDELLVNTTGSDFATILARFGGGTLKSLVLALAVLFLLWVVWGWGDGGDDVPFAQNNNATGAGNRPEKEIADEKEEEKGNFWGRFGFGANTNNNNQQNSTRSTPLSQESEIQKGTITKKKKVPPQNPQGELLIAAQHHQIAQAMPLQGQGQSIVTGSSVEQALELLAQANRVFDVPVSRQIMGKTDAQRAQSLDRLSFSLTKTIAQIQQTRTRLNQEFIQLGQESANYKTTKNQTRQQINQQIENTNSQKIEKLLAQHAEANDKAYRASSSAEIRRVLSEKLRKISASMSSLQTIMQANRQAIIKDVRVVDFASDPFGRVLTPAQWRAIAP